MKFAQIKRDGITTDIYPSEETKMRLESTVTLENSTTFELNVVELPLTINREWIKVPTFHSHMEGSAQDALEYCHELALEKLNRLKEMGCIL